MDFSRRPCRLRLDQDEDGLGCCGLQDLPRGALFVLLLLELLLLSLAMPDCTAANFLPFGIAQPVSRACKEIMANFGGSFLKNKIDVERTRPAAVR